MTDSLYRKLALGSVRRGKSNFIPQMILTAVMAGVYFLFQGLIYSGGIQNMPNGKITAQVLRYGTALFTLFVLFFLFYINAFLMKRRKRELGLYAVLGLSRGQIGRVLIWENAFVMGCGIALGVVTALVFGRLLFLILMRLVRFAGESTFSIGRKAYLRTFALFLGVFVVCTAYDILSVRLMNPIAMLKAEKKGEGKPRFLIPQAVIGLALMCYAYISAWTVSTDGDAVMRFFPLAMVVIAATYLLFSAGSVVALQGLQKNKHFYYQTSHFISVSGLIHRMKQNAMGLASICILSTMLVTTVCCTLSLYLEQDIATRANHPFDVEMVSVSDAASDHMTREMVAEKIHALAEENHVMISSDPQKMISYEDTFIEAYSKRMTMLPKGQDEPEIVGGLICNEDNFLFDVSGTQDDCLAFVREIQGMDQIVYDIFSATAENYATFGGLLFLGIFFGIVFLCVAVLIIYFKQLAEGMEDQKRFDLLQKVGMDHEQVRQTINRQILVMFFAPVVMTMIHMLFASRILTQMLSGFKFGSWQIILKCAGGTCIVFILIYLIVYRMTARAYLKLVERKA